MIDVYGYIFPTYPDSFQFTRYQDEPRDWYELPWLNPNYDGGASYDAPSDELVPLYPIEPRLLLPGDPPLIADGADGFA